MSRVVAWVLLILVLTTVISQAAERYLYRYRDANGQWVLQENPPPPGAIDASIIEVNSGKVFKYQPDEGVVTYTDQDPQRNIQSAPPSQTNPSKAPSRTPVQILPSMQLPDLGPAGRAAVKVLPVSGFDGLMKLAIALGFGLLALKILLIAMVGVPRSARRAVLFRGLFPYVKGWVGERSVRKAVEKSGFTAIHDVIIPGPSGGLTQIDHVVALPSGLLVLETKNYAGWLFGQAEDYRWTRVQGRRKDRFLNPLRQNAIHIQAIRSVAPAVQTQGLVVFVGSAKFPKGMPAGCVDLRGLKRRLKAEPKSGDITIGVATLREIEKLAAREVDARDRHFRQVSGRFMER